MLLGTPWVEDQGLRYLGPVPGGGPGLAGVVGGAYGFHAGVWVRVQYG